MIILSRSIQFEQLLTGLELIHFSCFSNRMYYANDDMRKSHNKLIVYVLQVRSYHLSTCPLLIGGYFVGPKGEKVRLSHKEVSHLIDFIVG